MKSIFTNIRKARKAAGKTQKEMADALNVNRSTYLSWENATIPGVEDLINIGKVLKIDWTSLVKETITGEPIKPGAYRSNSEIEELKDIAKATKEIAEAILLSVNEHKVKKSR